VFNLDAFLIKKANDDAFRVASREVNRYLRDPENQFIPQREFGLTSTYPRTSGLAHVIEQGKYNAERWHEGRI